MNEVRQIGDMIGAAILNERRFFTCPVSDVDCREANAPCLVVSFGDPMPRMFVGVESAPDTTDAYVLPLRHDMTAGEILGVLLFLHIRRAVEPSLLINTIRRLIEAFGDDAARVALDKSRVQA